MAKKMVRWEGSTRIEDKEAVAKRMRLMREGSKAYFRAVECSRGCRANFLGWGLFVVARA